MTSSVAEAGTRPGRPAKPSAKRFPVSEVFGPTVQGEGIDQGLPVHFIRLGGCDYRCTWCDTPYAVLPEVVRKAERLSAEAIVERVTELGGAPEWVVLSGGNPVLHELGGLVARLHEERFRVAVETQGSRWKDWLLDADRVCVSPKPPSSEMNTGLRQLDDFMSHASERCSPDGEPWIFLKVVVFDQSDYEYARAVHHRFPDLPFFVSAGNDSGATVGNPDRHDGRSLTQVRNDLCCRSAWLASKTMNDPTMDRVRVQSQYHVLLWGNKPGV